MKIAGAAIKWLFILCLPIMLVTASIGCALNSLWLYQYGFDKYDVSRTTELDNSNLEHAARGLIDYFNSDSEYISLTAVKDGKPFPLFNQREMVHLRDVKKLMWLDYRVLLGTLIYVLAYAVVCLLWQRKRHWRRLAQSLVRGSGIALSLMVLLGLGTLLNFEELFWQFHLLSFANDFWQLDPAKDYLIMLFPGGFWYDATLFCALGTAVGAVVLGGVGVGWYLCTRKE